MIFLVWKPQYIYCWYAGGQSVALFKMSRVAGQIRLICKQVFKHIEITPIDEGSVK